MVDVEPVGVAEIAERCGVKEITVRKWVERHAETFPAPRWRVSGRDAYDWRDVHAWLVQTERLTA